VDHGVADDCKRFLSDLFARDDIVRLLEIPGVYLARLKKALDLDRPRIFRTANDLILIVVAIFFRVLLVPPGWHCRRSRARGRLGKFHSAGRQALAARPLKIAIFH